MCLCESAFVSGESDSYSVAKVDCKVAVEERSRSFKCRINRQLWMDKQRGWSVVKGQMSCCGVLVNALLLSICFHPL